MRVRMSLSTRTTVLQCYHIRRFFVHSATEYRPIESPVSTFAEFRLIVNRIVERHVHWLVGDQCTMSCVLMIELIILFAGNLSPLDPYVVMLYWFLDLRFSVAKCDPPSPPGKWTHVCMLLSELVPLSAGNLNALDPYVVLLYRFLIKSKFKNHAPIILNNYQNIFWVCKKNHREHNRNKKYNLISLFWSFHNSIQQQMVIAAEKHKKQ